MIFITRLLASSGVNGPLRDQTFKETQMKLSKRQNRLDQNFFEAEGLDRHEIERIAFETGFCKRNSGKIKAPEFLIYFCLESLKGTVSLNDIASKMSADADTDASRQAYQQRMNAECHEFFKRILASVMASKNRLENPNAAAESTRFSRILVQDSTVVRLPLRLFEIFSGVKNAHTVKCNARIQGTYDLLAKQFVDFSIDPYFRNDLAAASDLKVEPGDLVLRDRGYFSVPTVRDLKEAGADTIFRYKHKTKIYRAKSGEEINLLEYLEKNGSMDLEVLVGKEKYKVRMSARPVDQETANLRRMRAKREMKGKNPSKELLSLMAWTIFITTIETEELTFESILKLYGLRWRIENIFKTWKSHFSFDRIHNVSEKQLRVLLTARLIMIVFINQRLYGPLSELAKKKSEKRISLMKFTRFIRRNIDFIYKIINIEKSPGKTLGTIVKYCTYDTRRRPNFETQLEQIILEMNELDSSPLT